MASQPYLDVALHPPPSEEVHATEGSHSHGLYLLLIRAEGNLQNLNGDFIVAILHDLLNVIFLPNLLKSFRIRFHLIPCVFPCS